MKLIVAMIRPDKLEAVQEALDEPGDRARDETASDDMEPAGALPPLELGRLRP